MIASLAAALASADEFPYSAHVADDDVFVHSGPGEKYYPSMKLARGAPVEVYRHDPGGWYAIRPPDGSFSWVSADFLLPDGDGQAVVTGDQVAARVGSELSDIRDVIQVRLDLDERVRVLDTQRIDEGPAQGTWYKIAPPAGEFRWIAARFLALDASGDPPGPRNNRSLTRPSNAPPHRRAADPVAHSSDEAEELSTDPDKLSGAESAQDDFSEDEFSEDRFSEADFSQDQPGDDEWATDQSAHDNGDNSAGARWTLDSDPDPDLQAVDHQDTALDNDSRGDSSDDDSRPFDQPADDQPPGQWKKASRPVERFSSQPSSQALRRISRRPGALSGNDTLADVDLAISAMLSETPMQWDFSMIRPRAEEVLRRSRSALERGRARRLLRKIDDFTELARRYETVMGSGEQIGTPAEPDPLIAAGPVGGERALSTSAAAEHESRFDGRGRLTRVISRQPGAPQFALLNDAGEVLYYVSPAPGVNLRNYLDQQIGITGTLGYLPEHHARHVTAKRIEVTDERFYR